MRPKLTPPHSPSLFLSPKLTNSLKGIGWLHGFFPWSIGSHSMDAGGTTFLAVAGVPPSQIQVIGHWKQTPLSATFVTIPCYCRLSYFMVSPFMTSHLLMYYCCPSFATPPINLLFLTLIHLHLPSPPLPRTPCYSVPSGFIMYSLISRCLGVPWLSYICNAILRWTTPSWFFWLLVLVPSSRLV